MESMRNNTAVSLCLVTFLAISLITNVMNSIFPSLEGDFSISQTVASFFPFAFFIAYGVMSIPAGILTEKLTEKPVLILAFSVSLFGTLVFASMPSLHIAIASLFCIGCAMALLQVVVNPLLRVSGGEENYAFYAVIGQLLFGVGGMVAPQIYKYFVQNLDAEAGPNIVANLLSGLVPSNMTWVSMYWLFAIISAALLVTMFVIRLPKVELTDEEKPGTIDVYTQLIKNKTVILFFIGIAAYVGTEVGIANAIGVFLKTYHGVDPVSQGADVISGYWTAMVIGCIFGMVLMKLFDCRHVLIACAAGAIVMFSMAIYGAAELSVWAFPAIGFFLSVMYPAIYSLGLNSLSDHHGSFAGILCTAIAGGAIVTPVVSVIADMAGELRTGMLFIFLPLCYIASIGFWAKPIIHNKTISFGSKNTVDDDAAVAD